MDTLSSIMERNEAYIYWLQPKNGGLQDQIAAVSINNTLYSINLRLEKAIFRRVRLSKTFMNVEFLQDGTEKLRIPTRLLREKQRTSQRHMVTIYSLFFLSYLILTFYKQAMTQKNKESRVHKGGCFESSKCIHEKIQNLKFSRHWSWILEHNIETDYSVILTQT